MVIPVVVCPTYADNDSRLSQLRYSLTSINRQTVPCVCIVVDDGSSSDVQGFIKQFGTRRIRYARRERKPTDLRTSSNAANLGIDLALEGSS